MHIRQIILRLAPNKRMEFGKPIKVSDDLFNRAEQLFRLLDEFAAVRVGEGVPSGTERIAISSQEVACGAYWVCRNLFGGF
jgi:hypothetical protein